MNIGGTRTAFRTAAGKAAAYVSISGGMLLPSACKIKKYSVWYTNVARTVTPRKYGRFPL
jgi:hypothetical protein